jgi:hypothetical protein
MLNIALVPTLKCNDIVVINNLRAHKIGGGREAIETARATFVIRLSIPRP